MILTLTPNPSIDSTMQLDCRLERGQVLRPTSTSQVAGGKGVNVTNAINLAGLESLAIFPADAKDPFSLLVAQAEIPSWAVPIDDSVRINTTVTEPDGTTTKINGRGAPLDTQAQQRIIEALEEAAENATWLVLAGSLPPGVNPDWYSTLIATLRKSYPELKIAVDTSDAAMEELGKHLNTAAPTLIKPNGLELGQLIGQDGQQLEKDAENGNFDAVVAAARKVVDRGIPEILVTLGGAGAALVTAQGAWVATPPPTEVLSTVGAGDSSLAGYLMARVEGLEPGECLRRAVAYGSAAAGLPGTTIPTPAQLDLEHTLVTALDALPGSG